MIFKLSLNHQQLRRHQQPWQRCSITLIFELLMIISAAIAIVQGTHVLSSNDDDSNRIIRTDVVDADPHRVNYGQFLADARNAQRHQLFEILNYLQPPQEPNERSYDHHHQRPSIENDYVQLKMPTDDDDGDGHRPSMNHFQSSKASAIRTSSAVAAAAEQPPVQAAVQTKRYVEFITYPRSFESVDSNVVKPQVIEVDSITSSVQFVFRSKSGPLMFKQIHQPSASPSSASSTLMNEPLYTRSEEPVQLLKHEIYKPIVQELNEIIQLYRQITQEIKPVMEEVRTIVAQSAAAKKVANGDAEQRPPLEDISSWDDKQNSTTGDASKRFHIPIPGIISNPISAILPGSNPSNSSNSSNFPNSNGTKSKQAKRPKA